MSTWQADQSIKFAHSWWRQIRLSYVPAQTSPLIDEFISQLLEKFRQSGHEVYDQPQVGTDVLFTTAQFNEPIRWREAMIFNGIVLDQHPYVADEIFAREEGIFGKRLVAGSMVFSLGLGLMAHNNVNTFSYGYDKLRFIKPVFIGDTIYTVRTHLRKVPKYKEMGLVTVSYEVFKNKGELVLYCEHLQTVKYRNPDSIKK